MTATFTEGAKRFRLREDSLMDAQQKLAIGRRIKELRDNSPETNRSIADYVGVGERSVAHWVAGNGITYDHAQKVAKLFGVEVDYIWRGREKAPTPDVLGALTAGESPGGASADLLEQVLAAQTTMAAELSEFRMQVERAIAVQAEQSARLSEALLVLGEIRTRLERIERGQEGTGS